MNDLIESRSYPLEVIARFAGAIFRVPWQLLILPPRERRRWVVRHSPRPRRSPYRHRRKGRAG